MGSRICRIVLILLFCLVWRAEASPETRRQRDGIRYYRDGHYEQARHLFQKIVRSGKSPERPVAQSYLKRLEERLPPPQAGDDLSKEARAFQLIQTGAALMEKSQYNSAEFYFIDVAASGTPQQQKLAKDMLQNIRRIQEEQDSLRGPEGEIMPPAAVRAGKKPWAQWSGYLKTEAAYRTSEPNDWTKLRGLSFLAVTGQPSESLGYRISGRAFYDAVYDWTTQYPAAVAEDQRKEAVLRDAYLDYSKGNWDIRAGKQQIVWGEAVGLFYADIVNAKDFREFILPDFDFIRIPQWGVDVEYSVNDLHMEGVWLPVLEFNRMARPGAEFGVPLPTVPGVPTSLAEEQKPANTWENSEFGGRMGYRFGRLDASAFVFRTWDKFPNYERQTLPTQIVLIPTHRRLTYSGLTMTAEAYETIFKTEAVVALDKPLSSNDFADADGLVTRTTLEYYVGADHALWNWDCSLQWGQQWILNFTPDLLNQRESRSTLAFSVRRSFRSNTLEPQLVAVADLSQADWMLRPRLDYKFARQWRISLGADIFGGSSSGLFGQYDARDRVYNEFTFSF